MPADIAPSGLGTSISVSSVRVSGCSASAIRVTFPGNVRSGISGTCHDRLDTGLQPECLILRHEHLRSDHVGLHEREHERAARCVGLHQGADIDVALGYDAVEGRHDLLIDLFLLEHLELGFLRLDTLLRNADGRCQRLEILLVD